MATILLTMNACGGSSTSQKIYYGKTSLVTGNALTGTGWTLYSGASISASTTSVSITPLENNIDYSVERYCNCPTSGDTGPERIDNLIKYVCGEFPTLSAGSTTASYNVFLPASLNSAGSWVDKVVVELLNSNATVILQSNTINRPFSSSNPGSFSGLTVGTSYQIRLKYSTNSGSRVHDCPVVPLTTSAACSAPTVTLSGVNPTSMVINWTVASSNPGDTYNIIKNGTTIASGLSLTSSPYSLTGLAQNTLYQIGVQRNCGTSGSATGQAFAFTTNAPSLTMTCNDIPFPNLRDQCWTVGDSVAVGNRFVLTAYGLNVTYTAISGDNKYDVAAGLAAAINAISKATWDAAPGSPAVKGDYVKPFASEGNPPGYVVVTRIQQVNTTPLPSFTGAAYTS